MKERVIGNLRLFANPEILREKNDMFLKVAEETNIAEIALHKRSKRVLQSILHNYSAFNITTIDSFTHRLIRSFAFDLGLSLNFDVEMDVKSVLNEAVDLLIAKIGEDKELTKILIDFSLQKANEDKSWDISLELKEISQLLLNENDLLHVQKLKDKSLADFLNLKESLQQKINIIEARFEEIAEEALALIYSTGVEINQFSHSGELPRHFIKLKGKQLGNLIFDGRLNTNISKDYHFHAGKASIQDKARIDSIIDELKILYLNSKEKYESTYKNYVLYSLFLKNLIPLAVLSKINESLEELKEEKNIYLNAEFNQIISEHLREQPAAFIYERIGERYKHYFIDEMQDTSKLQWQNLIPLIANALSQENSSLLLVGDAKQSIYRWRGGEPEQFIGLSGDENPFFIEKKDEFLATNRRSYSEIIDFNNEFFQFVSRYFNSDSISKIYEKDNRQESTDKIGGYVNISFIEEGLSAAEKDIIFPEKVVNIIEEVKKEFDLNEICVLTRTRKQGVVIANYLTSHGIAIISSETLLLQNSVKVQFIIDVLTFLQQQSNKKAKLEIVYFLYDHLEIRADKHEFLDECIAYETSQLFEKLCKHGAEFNYQEFGKLPFYESVEAIIRGFKLTETSDAYLQFFLDEVLNYSIKKSDGAHGFLAFWHEKKDNLSIMVPEEKNAVRIMTIHKSKGLEFPVVIFPYDLNIHKELSPKTWYPIEEREAFGNFESLLISATASLEQTGEMGALLYQQRRNELELDNLNLLYVTLTRAVEQLYVVSEQRKTSAALKWYSHFFIEYLKDKKLFEASKGTYEFGSKNRISSKKQKFRSSIEQTQFISSSWQDHQMNIVATSALLWDSDKGDSLGYGNLIHELLSKVKTAADIDLAVEHYLINGMITSEELKELTETAGKIVNHPMLQQYFEQNKTIFCEREILTADKGIMIPDRLVIDENKNAYIIDYKTGKPDKKHHSQLHKYALAVEELGFQVRKKMLVYIDDSIEVEFV